MTTRRQRRSSCRIELVKASLHIRTVLSAPDVLVVEEVENIGVVERAGDADCC